ncbi:hypothetical protein [Streptomyces sp. NPDC127092]|uniref:hypothetical protein n=1 Tax=Streptomyces sp. NPDC127092 TaxID=3347135 RepID=UPI003649D8D6
MTDPHETIRWGHDALELEISLGEHAPARLIRLGAPGEKTTAPRPAAPLPLPLPLVEVTTAGLGRDWSGRHLVNSVLGSRLRDRSHRATRDGDWHVLTVDLHEPETGLTARAVHRSRRACRCCAARCCSATTGRGRCTWSRSARSWRAASPEATRRPWRARSCCGRRTSGSPNAAGSTGRCGPPRPSEAAASPPPPAAAPVSSPALDWLDGVLDRHPDLVIENCASGGMRMDHALLSRLQLQSTSDQQDLLRYPPIAAAAPTAVTPEQGAVWAYPLPEDSLDEVAFTMAGALLGRIHLSGRITELSPEARTLVHEAVTVHKSIRADLPQALPSWPIGLPGWEDPWIALALHTPATTYVTAWRRSGEEPVRDLGLPHLAGADVRVEVLYPSSSRAATAWNPDTAELTLTLPTDPSAVLLRLTRPAPVMPMT